MNSMTDSQAQSLKHTLNSITWVLHSTCIRNGLSQDNYWTGFSINNDGCIMTTISGYNQSKSGIKARKLDSGTFKSARVVFRQPKWDLMMLKVEDNACQPGILARNGSIYSGETLVSMAHPNQLVGSFLIGHASFRCIDDASVPPPEDNQNCLNYYPTLSNITTPYRTMGDTWNAGSLTHSQLHDITKDFDNLNPLLPVIQCNGFGFDMGCSGAPVLNIQRELVGMLHSKYEGVDVALHVALLKKFKTMAGV